MAYFQRKLKKNYKPAVRKKMAAEKAKKQSEGVKK
jgi:hypothetical protein